MRDIDEVIRKVRAREPNADWSQLKIKHPGTDDDGVWFFRLPHRGIEVQVESSRGVCPFTIETDAHERRLLGATVERTVEIVIAWLEGKSEPPETTSDPSCPT